MDKRSASRRKILAGAISVVPGYVLSSAAAAAGVKNGSQVAARHGGGRRLSMPRGVTLDIESLDPRLSFTSSFDTVNVPFRKVVGFLHDTSIPAPYYFDVDIDEQSAVSADWHYTVNLYDAEGDDLGSITTSDGGTAIFLEQQAMFRVHANFD